MQFLFKISVIECAEMNLKTKPEEVVRALSARIGRILVEFQGASKDCENAGKHLEPTLATQFASKAHEGLGFLAGYLYALEGLLSEEQFCQVMANAEVSSEIAQDNFARAQRILLELGNPSYN